MNYLLSRTVWLAAACVVWASAGCSTTSRDFAASPGAGSPDSSVSGSGGAGGQAGGAGGSGGIAAGGGGSGGVAGVIAGASGTSGTSGGPIGDGAAGAPPDAPATGRSNGSACTANTQCTSNNCVDGVCCNTTCTGSCEQCNLPNLAGTCSPVPASLAAPSPHAACAKDAASTCKKNGLCDGKGGCQLYPDGTACAAASCDATANQFVDAAKCDGAGTCKPARTLTCAPFKCVGPVCATSCAADTDCVGQPCLNKSCGKMIGGSACTSNAQCQSNFCVDGLCCDGACTEQCKACNVTGSEGKCTPVTSGQPHGVRAHCDGENTTCSGTCAAGTTSCTYPTTSCRSLSCTNGVQTLAASCSAGVCPTVATSTCLNGFGCNGTSCFTTCADDSQCGAAAPYCNAGACQALKPNGRACGTSSECANSNCVDGYCCGSACTEPCKACDVAGSLGTCTQVTSGQPHGSRTHCTGEGSTCGGACAAGSSACTYPTTPCRAASCASGVQTLTANCTAGSCPAAQTVACSGGLGCKDATTCNGSCADDAQCLPATPYCNGATCQAKKPNGRACGAASECANNFCVDGYCCNAACTEQCKACDIVGAQGACTQLTTGQPHGIRTACSGSGACAGYCGPGNTSCTYPSGQCRAAACGSNIETHAANCSGGSCPNAVTAACTPYVCGTTACRTNCSSDSDCQASPSPFCAAGTCKAQAGNGHVCPCGADGACSKCSSGYCTDGYCCGSQNCGDCATCAKTGYQGSCQPLARRTACGGDPMICDGTTLWCTWPTLPCGPSATCAVQQMCNWYTEECTNDSTVSYGLAHCAKQDDCPFGEVCCYQGDRGGSRTECRLPGNCPEQDNGSVAIRLLCTSSADCTSPSYPNCTGTLDASGRYHTCQP